MVEGFGWRLRITRRNAGYTQLDIARLCMVSRGTVSRWEKLIQPPPTRGRETAQIAELLGVSPEWLRTGEDGKPPEYELLCSLMEDSWHYMQPQDIATLVDMVKLILNRARAVKGQPPVGL